MFIRPYHSLFIAEDFSDLIFFSFLRIKIMEDLRKNVESRSSTGSAYSFIVGEDPVLPLISEAEHTDNKGCITTETAIASMPVHALQTVMLLETPPVQDVVESIARDENVWNAVMQNEALQEFILSHKTSAPSLDEFNDQGFPKNSEESSDQSQSGHIGTGFMEMLQDIKLFLVGMTSNLPGFIQNISRTPAGEHESVNVAAKDINNTSILGASVMGLAVLVIIMAALKKN